MITLPENILSTIAHPMFGVLLTLCCFQLGCFIRDRMPGSVLKMIFNPLIIAIVLIISTLLFFNLDHGTYYAPADSVITFFLGPATVMLAIPLYKQIEVLKKSGLPILLGILVGATTAIIVVIFLNMLVGLEGPYAISTVPKSVTAAVSQEISAAMGGIPALTVAVTVMTGITGNVLGQLVLKFCRVKDPVAQGVALGCTSHVIGTAKAIEMGEIQAAMGSLSISIAAIMATFLAPFLYNLLG